MLPSPQSSNPPIPQFPDVTVGDAAGAEEGEGGERRSGSRVPCSVFGRHLFLDAGDEVDEVARTEQHDEVAGFKGQVKMSPRLFRASGEKER